MTLAIVNLFHESNLQVYQKLVKPVPHWPVLMTSFIHDRESSFLTVKGQFRSLFSKNS